ncbi:glycosyltransferase family 2 protein [Halalkalicoccus subterraneus]|uniref:glycosyltransferase family 2 protein n=1 Tax=Halalkalicoccus subterraneus TaxID=2675002 RepID=UPI000EFA8CD1|nr:glycosyltransferase family 2 protein [Halalkalicoccus subterraneus]
MTRISAVRRVATAALAALFWGALFALAQTYVLYGALLGALAGRSEPESDRNQNHEYPTVTLVIAAYNEEGVIAEKIENSLELEYPDDKLEVVVFSDASSDRTDEIVASYADRGVELRRIEGRVGKTACQNAVVEDCDSEVVVFSDANGMYEPDAIERLVERFEPGVGCVVGELRYREAGVEGESVYWRYERRLRTLESRIGTLVSGNGSIYAVRRSSYVPLDSDEISDFAELLAVIETGERVTYAPEAIAWEDTGDSVDSEFDRRVRITTRAWHTLVRYPSLLDPVARPRVAFQLTSHKLLRWLSPVFLGIAFLANVGLVALGAGWLYALSLVGQTACYALAGVGGLAERTGRPTGRLVSIPYYFLSSNYAMALGLKNFLAGRNVVTWETVERE